MKADLQRWLIESGEAGELVAFLREERACHPVPPPRVAVTTSLDVDVFDAMMARAASGASCRARELSAPRSASGFAASCLRRGRQN